MDADVSLVHCNLQLLVYLPELFELVPQIFSRFRRALGTGLCTVRIGTELMGKYLRFDRGRRRLPPSRNPVQTKVDGPRAFDWGSFGHAEARFDAACRVKP
jgi:hypothetical protein